MQSIDDEVYEHAVDFIGRQHAADTPFFLWFNTTHMHFRTHAKPETIGRAGRWQSPYHDAMVDHDELVGELLDTLDELSSPTTPSSSTHRQRAPPELVAGRRDDAVPQREELELGRRLPRPPADPLAGKIPAGDVSNEIIQHLDWLPTFLAVAGEPASSRS